MGNEEGLMCISRSGGEREKKYEGANIEGTWKKPKAETRETSTHERKETQWMTLIH